MFGISSEERRGRLERCARALQNQGADCLLLLPGANFFYFTGLSLARERHRSFVAAIFDDGTLALLAPVFEENTVGKCPVPAEHHFVFDHENPFAALAHIIKTKVAARPRIALEPTIPFHFSDALQSAIPDASMGDGAAASDTLRAIKSRSEIEILREAARRTAQRMAAVPGYLRLGMSEKELGALFGPSAMVQVGVTTAHPNVVGGDNRLKCGDPIVIDAGDRVGGYRSDVTRTFFFGEPAPEMRAAYEVVRAAELAAIEAVRPGLPAQEIDLIARRTIESAGFGDRFIHRGGHGIGLEFHERPICVRGNDAPLEPGMVLTVEPGIYVPGAFGIRLEDDILVTEDGFEILSAPLPPVLSS